MNENTLENSMTESWKQWEGRVVDGEFRLGRYLGGSDHSAVFLTEHRQQPGQLVAIKLIATDAQRAEQQLLRWQKASRLSHPHLLRMFQAGRCKLDNVSLLYVVMECAEEDLSQIVPQRPLTPAEAKEVLSAVLSALAYVHEKGFVHGHLKPANITAVGETIKISSDTISPAGDSTVDMAGIGAHAAPEGTGGGISPAFDVWSLGVTLVEILTQHPPAQAALEHGDPDLPQLPPRLTGIVRQCLRRDPQRRWTVDEIAGHLQPAPRRSRESVPTASRIPFVKWVYVAAVVVAVLAVAAMLTLPRVRDRHAATPPNAPVTSAPATPEPQPRPPVVQAKTKTEKPKPAAAVPTLPPAPAKQSTPEPVHGGVVQQVLPDVPRSAANTIQGRVKVKVRVMVDPSGSVSQASFESAGPSKYFANLAMQAARKWKFATSPADRRKVPGGWILQFEFRRSGTKATAAPAA